MESITQTPVPGGWTEREVAIGPHRFRLATPAEPDAFLEQLEEPAANGQPHLADPYWAKLWPAAIDLAAAIARRSGRLPLPLGEGWGEGECLELGCGSGLVGLACLAAGLNVTFSDYVPFTVELALENAVRNGFANAQGLVLDWRQPIDRQWPLIVAADVTYDRTHISPLLNVLERMLAPNYGRAWFGDAGRGPAEEFVGTARSRGWIVEIFDANDQPAASIELGQFRRIVLKK